MLFVNVHDESKLKKFEIPFGDPIKLKNVLKEISKFDYFNLDDLKLLHLASIYGNVESIDVLIFSGINLNFRDTNGNSPLELAILNHQIKVIEKLISNNADYSNAIEFAKNNNKKEIADQLVGNN